MFRLITILINLLYLIRITWRVCQLVYFMLGDKSEIYHQLQRSKSLTSIYGCIFLAVTVFCYLFNYMYISSSPLAAI